MIYLPIVYVAALAGGWMFFVQHQYEDVYWEQNDAWSYHLAGLLGSSYYQLPKALQWLTGIPTFTFSFIIHLAGKVKSDLIRQKNGG